ncbi:MAG: hypothetical protein ACRC30_15310 [Clostridium sp.]
MVRKSLTRKQMKKIIGIIVGVLVICIVCGGSVYLIHKRNLEIVGGVSKEQVSKANSTSEKQSTNEVEQVAEISKLPDTKFLVGKVGANTLVVKLDKGNKEENEIDTTSFYMNQGGSLGTKITTDNGNYVVTETYNNNPIGVYTLKKEGNNLVGSFKDINDKSKSLNEVKLTFTNNIQSYYPTNDTIGFAEKIFQNKVIDANAKDLSKVTWTKGKKAVIWEISNKQFEVLQKEHWTDEEAAQSQVPDNAIVLLSDKSNSFMPKDTNLGKADFLLNGIKVWRIAVWPGSTYLDGAKMHGTLLLGENGFIFNNEDMFQAAKNGYLMKLNENGQYEKVSTNDLLKNSQTSEYVLQDNGSTVGLICSADNPESKTFMDKFYKLREAYFAKVNAQYYNQS